MSIIEHPKINEWLTLVEHEMRVTLAKLLAEAVKGVGQFREGSIDSTKYLEWVDQYQVRQDIILFMATAKRRFDILIHNISLSITIS